MRRYVTTEEGFNAVNEEPALIYLRDMVCGWPVAYVALLIEQVAHLRVDVSVGVKVVLALFQRLRCRARYMYVYCRDPSRHRSKANLEISSVCADDKPVESPPGSLQIMHALRPDLMSRD